MSNQPEPYSPIYLICGTESFIMNETIKKILKEVLDEETQEFNFAVYDMEETDVEVAIDDALTLPFLGERRVILINKPFFLTGEKKQQSVEHHIEKLEEYIKDPNPSTILIIQAPYEKLDERKKLTKLLKKEAEIVEAKPLTGKRLEQWIVKQAEKHQLKMDADALETFLHLGGTELSTLIKEIEKLALYKQKGEVISKEDVESLISKTLETNIFSFVDKIVKKDTHQGFAILNDLLKQKEEPIKLLALLASQFRIIYQVKAYMKKGYGQKQIASILKANPFRVQVASKQAVLFEEKELQTIMSAFAQADYEMKTGKMEKELALELLLMKVHHIRVEKR